jgi:hypothetical protein
MHLHLGRREFLQAGAGLAAAGFLNPLRATEARPSARSCILVYLLGGPPQRVSRAGGLLPRWRGDGSEIFFIQPDGLMMALRSAGADVAPTSLFHLEGVVALDFDYDVARDGQRFLVRLTPEAEGAAGLRVALEWSQR